MKFNSKQLRGDASEQHNLTVATPSLAGLWNV